MKSTLGSALPWLRLLVLGSTLLGMGLSEVVPLISSTGDTLLWEPIPPQIPEPGNSPIRFLTANLWHDYPRYRDLEARWARLARAFREQQVDIACLQEVTWTERFGNHAQRLAREVGAAYVYGRANGKREVLGFEEGLAIVSRYPLRDARLVEVQPQASPLAHRIVLRATAETPAGEIAVYCTHLTVSRRVIDEQIVWLRDFVEQDAGGRTAIIGGDFNAGEGNGALMALAENWVDTYRSLHPEGSGLTFSLELPLLGWVPIARYDYIFHKEGKLPLNVSESRFLFDGDARISDHYAVLTGFEVGP